MNESIFVYGAYGHTGRFVISELRRRGWTAIAAGRDRRALAELGQLGYATRHLSIDEPDALTSAAADAGALLNCAGPFVDTAAPLIAAALRLGIPYLDITGEPDVVAETFEHFDAAAIAAGIAVVPAAGFFGALADLLVIAALDGERRADRIAITYALDEWRPTPGTRRAAHRIGGRRLVHRHGHLDVVTTPPPAVTRELPPPIGSRSTIGEYPSPESVLIPRHIATPDLEIFMTVEAIRDLLDPHGTGPVAVNDEGRSGQTFVVHAEATRDGLTTNALACGSDIYATTAPILVACMERLLRAEHGVGVHAVGELVQPREFLGHLMSHDVQITIDAQAP